MHIQISTYELLHDQVKSPPVLNPTIQEVFRFQNQCDVVARLLLGHIESSLGFPLGRRHSPDETSESGLKLIYEPCLDKASDVIENKHRDSGTLTMLFYDTVGVQIYLGPDKEGSNADLWIFLPPPPEGHVLVHSGSSLERLTEGKVKAPLHRVTQGEDGAKDRYFLSYFLRPEHKLAEQWAN